MAHPEEVNKNHNEVAVAQTDQKIGRGQRGDVIERIVVTIDTVGAGGAVSLKDGSGGASIPLVPASTAIGVYSIKFGGAAKGETGNAGWHVTTGANASAIVLGNF